MFLVKKIVGHLLMPLPLALGLLTLGLLLIGLRRRARGWALIGLGWLVLVVASNRGVSHALTASLETQFPPAPVSPVDTWPAELRESGFVAVLGGGNGDRPGLSAGQRLSPSARARLVEGLRVALALPGSWLVVSGPTDAFDDATVQAPVPHARVLADAAVELGFPRERIVEITTARDTAEEVVAIKQLIGEERVALVSSAWHLPRAMHLAETEGVAAFACPADYLGGRDARVKKLSWVTWDGESLVNTTRAWREYLGQAWASTMARWRR
jgi:uncharacterized SAM-binding protein YcdF (DUF218 family)